jgi:uncharacterized tellurite resistance protein B-like protein
MRASITGFFKEFLLPDEPVSETDDNHDVRFATATLLMEVSRAEDSSKELEKNAILKILQRLFDFSDAEVSQLMELAEDASEEAHDLYSFTKLINEHYDYTAKTQLIKNLWEVAFADGRIDAFEEHIIRRISGLVHLANQDFIHAKILARKSSA